MVADMPHCPIVTRSISRGSVPFCATRRRLREPLPIIWRAFPVVVPVETSVTRLLVVIVLSTTWSFAVGIVVQIPTSPPTVIRTFSVLLVANARAPLSTLLSVIRFVPVPAHCTSNRESAFTDTVLRQVLDPIVPVGPPRNQNP